MAKIKRSRIYSANVPAEGLSPEVLKSRLNGIVGIESWIFILHNRDINAVGEDVADHFYVALRFATGYTVAHVAKGLGCPPTAVQKSVAGVMGRSMHNAKIAPQWLYPLMLEYATHGNDESKTPYDDSEVVAKDGFDWIEARSTAEKYTNALATKKLKIFEKLDDGSMTLEEVLSTQRASWIKANARKLLEYAEPLPVLNVVGSNSTVPALPHTNITKFDNIYELNNLLAMRGGIADALKKFDEVDQKYQELHRNLPQIKNSDGTYRKLLPAQQSIVDREHRASQERTLLSDKIQGLRDNQVLPIVLINNQIMQTLEPLHDQLTEMATLGLAKNLAELNGETYVINKPSAFDGYGMQPVLLINMNDMELSLKEIDNLRKRVYNGQAFPWLKLLVFYNSNAMTWNLQRIILRLNDYRKEGIKRPAYQSLFDESDPVVEVSIHPTVDDDAAEDHPELKLTPTTKNVRWVTGVDPLDDDASAPMQALCQSLEALNDSYYFSKETWATLGVTVLPGEVWYRPTISSTALQKKELRIIKKHAAKKVVGFSTMSNFLHDLVGDNELVEDNESDDLAVAEEPDEDVQIEEVVDEQPKNHNDDMSEEELTKIFGDDTTPLGHVTRLTSSISKQFHSGLMGKDEDRIVAAYGSDKLNDQKIQDLVQLRGEYQEKFKDNRNDDWLGPIYKATVAVVEKLLTEMGWTEQSRENNSATNPFPDTNEDEPSGDGPEGAVDEQPVKDALNINPFANTNESGHVADEPEAAKIEQTVDQKVEPEPAEQKISLPDWVTEKQSKSKVVCEKWMPPEYAPVEAPAIDKDLVKLIVRIANEKHVSPNPFGLNAIRDVFQSDDDVETKANRLNNIGDQYRQVAKPDNDDDDIDQSALIICDIVDATIDLIGRKSKRRKRKSSN